jgi:hypothetical protein
VERFETLSSGTPATRRGFADMTKKISEYQEFLKKDDEVSLSISKFDIEALPILEYFMIRIFQSLRSINIEYVAEVHSLNSEGLEIVAILNDARFNLLRRISNFERIQQKLPHIDIES